MRVQLPSGEIVDTNPQRARQLLSEGATVVNPQVRGERVAVAKKKPARKRAVKRTIVKKEE